MAFVLGDLKKTPGKSNMGGVYSKAWYAPLDDIDFAEALVLSAAGKLDFAGPLVMKAGKKFVELQSTPGKNGMELNSVGEVDGMSVESKYEFLFPGSDQAAAEFEAYALNTACVIVVPDTTGKLRVLGLIAPDWLNSTVITGDIWAHLSSVKGTLGKARADLKGTTFEFTHNAAHPPLYYTGAVPIA